MSADAMLEHTIIFSGPAGAGKTSALAALDLKSPQRQRPALAPDTMDHGVLQLSRTERIHCYGISGRYYSEHAQVIPSANALGLVLLLDNTLANPFAELDFHLDVFGDFIDRSGLVIGVTKMDIGETPSLVEYNNYLRKQAQLYPVFEVDTRKQRDVAILIQALLYCIDPRIRACG
ncbi:MAG: GTP-binding protein [Pseudomonadota bacterium]